MFEYCNRNIISITSTIGNFLSNNVEWKDKNNKLLSVDKINEWDRYHIAKRYMNEYFCRGLDDNRYLSIGGINNKDIFLREVAVKIDEYIPRCYFRKYCTENNIFNTKNGTRLVDLFISKDDHEFTSGLKYKLIDSSTLVDKIQEKEIFQINRKSNYQASDKQIRFLTSLVKKTSYIIKKPLYLMSMEEASELITYFKEGGNIPNSIDEYFEYDEPIKTIKEDEKQRYIEFTDYNAKLSKLKEWKIISPTATKIKTIYYKGVYTDEPVECEIIGYTSKRNNSWCINKYYESVYISFNGEIRHLLPEYLKQMQSSKFNRLSTENIDE